MRLTLFIVGLVSIVFVLSMPAYSQVKTKTHRKTVNSGKLTRVGVIQGWDKRTCKLLKNIEVNVVDEPKFGTVSVRVLPSKKIQKKGVFGSTKCAGRKAAGLGIYYRSKSGFRGYDKLKVSAGRNSEIRVYFRYVVNVR